MRKTLSFVLLLVASLGLGCGVDMDVSLEPGGTGATTGKPATDPDAALSRGGADEDDFTPPVAPYKLLVEAMDPFEQSRAAEFYMADETGFYTMGSDEDGNTLLVKYDVVSKETTSQEVKPKDGWLPDDVVASGGKLAAVRLINDDLKYSLGLLDCPSGEISNIFQTPQNTLYHAISADGKTIVGGDYDSVSSDNSALAVFNVETGEELAKIKLTGVDLNDMSISAGGEFVAFKSHYTESGPLKLWDITKNEIRELATVGDISPQISSDGKLIATATPGSRVYPSLILLDVASGKVSLTLTNDKFPGDLAFSADGKLLVSTWALGGGGALFDVASGGIVAEIDTKESLFKPKFTADGQYLTAVKNPTDIKAETDEMLVWKLSKEE